MAPKAPELVASLILRMSSTTNVRVLQDFVDAALGMPTTVAKTLVPKAKRWIRSSYQLLLPDKLGKLVGHLAAGGELDAALDLAGALLAVVPDPRRASDPSLLPEAVARFDQWTYERILQEHLDELVAAGRFRTLHLLCEVLSSAVKLSTRPNGQRKAHSDLSYIWRMAIEPSGQNIEPDIKNVLVSAVRDVAEKLAAQNRTALPEVVATLEAHKWDIFRRIALHVLRSSPKPAKTIVAARLTDPSLVDDVAVYHEFWLLAHGEFRNLSAADRNRLLQAIDDGPPRKQLRETLGRWDDKPPSDDDLDRYIKQWQLRRLTLLGSVLPPKWARRRDELAAELGELEHPEFLSYMSEMKTGPNSPRSAEDIAALPIPKLVAYLRDWKPSGDWMDASPEGLGRELSKVVAANPKPYAKSARQFRGLDPTYVRAFIQGFEQALKSKTRFEWAAVLELSAWVVAQPREIPERSGNYLDVDPGWVWARNAVANLLSAGLEAGLGALPFRVREKVWAILLPLTEDPEPTPEYEAKYGGSNMGPATMSINTTRGEAMHAAIRYGLWVRRHLEQKKQMADLAAGFDVMPELRQALDAHLDPEQDPSLTIRAVYGQWLPWLILLDRPWVEKKISQIFPWDSKYDSLALVAWDTYIAFNQAFNSSLEVLKTEYARAPDRLGRSRTHRPDVADPDVKLAHHLMVFYWQGTLGLEPNGLVDQFFIKGSDVLRAHGLDFVGRSLRNTEGDVPEVVLERLRNLWVRELNRARREGGEASREELATFGWWFSSGKFDDEWALEQLLESLRLGRKTDFSHMVAERLATIVESYPVQAVKIVSLLIDADDRIGVVGWASQAKQILAAALRSGDARAQESATNVINILGARRYSEFGELLHDDSKL